MSIFFLFNMSLLRLKLVESIIPEMNYIYNSMKTNYSYKFKLALSTLSVNAQMYNTCKHYGLISKQLRIRNN